MTKSQVQCALFVIALLSVAYVLQTDIWRPIAMGKRFSAQDIVAALRDSGCKVEQVGDSAYDQIFGAERLSLRVDGTSVQVYRYPRSITAQIGDQGWSVNGAQLEWIKPPHYLRFSNVLVVVLTPDDTELKRIEKALSGLR